MLGLFNLRESVKVQSLWTRVENENWSVRKNPRGEHSQGSGCFALKQGDNDPITKMTLE